MSCWNKEELEQMLEDVVNALDLAEGVIEEHGPRGTPPAELVRLVLEQKDHTIRNLRAGMVDCTPNATHDGRRIRRTVDGIGKSIDRNCDNCGYKVPEETRLASQPKCERPIDNTDDACRNFAKWIPNGKDETHND